MDHSTIARGDLKRLDTHFAFGKNWEEYSHLINEDRIEDAIQNLRRLLGVQTLRGKSFLDVGCGSGLHSLAALRIGAERVIAIDIDPVSVQTTHKILTNFAPNAQFLVIEKSAFDLPDAEIGKFDFVYSW